MARVLTTAQNTAWAKAFVAAEKLRDRSLTDRQQTAMLNNLLTTSIPKWSKVLVASWDNYKRLFPNAATDVNNEAYRAIASPAGLTVLDKYQVSYGIEFYKLNAGITDSQVERARQIAIVNNPPPKQDITSVVRRSIETGVRVATDAIGDGVRIVSTPIEVAALVATGADRQTVEQAGRRLLGATVGTLLGPIDDLVSNDVIRPPESGPINAITLGLSGNIAGTVRAEQALNEGKRPDPEDLKDLTALGVKAAIVVAVAGIAPTIGTTESIKESLGAGFSVAKDAVVTAGTVVGAVRTVQNFIDPKQAAPAPADVQFAVIDDQVAPVQQQSDGMILVAAAAAVFFGIFFFL